MYIYTHTLMYYICTHIEHIHMYTHILLIYKVQYVKM